MKLFSKKKYPNGKREVYILGIRVFGYKKNTMKDNPNKADLLRSMGIKVGENTKIWGMPNLPTEHFFIEIGKNTTIATDVTFLTHDGSMNACRKYYKNWYEGIPSPLGTVKIGDNCFVGIKSIILPNVTIGDNSVVGAGSVVTKNIPEGEVWGGGPCLLY